MNLNKSTLGELEDFFLLTGLDAEINKISTQLKTGETTKYKVIDFLKNMILNYQTNYENEKTILEYFKRVPENLENIENLELNSVSVKNPSQLPDPSSINAILEPYLKIDLLLPEIYLGKVIELINEARGHTELIDSISPGQICINAIIPLAEVIVDFYDRLKSISKGYASMSYNFYKYKSEDLVKLDILLNGKIVQPLSVIKHRSNSEAFGRKLCEKLKDLIPRQQIEVAIQAAIGSRVIARETIKPFRKDVTAKLYGGDISRRMKLLDKQKDGKKRMKSFGNVNVPKEVFIDVLKN